MVKRMLAKGYDVDTIRELTGLPVERIEKVKESTRLFAEETNVAVDRQLHQSPGIDGFTSIKLDQRGKFCDQFDNREGSLSPFNVVRQDAPRSIAFVKWNNRSVIQACMFSGEGTKIKGILRRSIVNRFHLFYNKAKPVYESALRAKSI